MDYSKLLNLDAIRARLGRALSRVGLKATPSAGAGEDISFKEPRESIDSLIAGGMSSQSLRDLSLIHI